MTIYQVSSSCQRPLDVGRDETSDSIELQPWQPIHPHLLTVNGGLAQVRYQIIVVYCWAHSVAPRSDTMNDSTR